MKKENYYSLTVWGLLLLLLCVFPFRLHAQGKTLSRLQAPRDSVQQPVKLSQASRTKKVGISKKADTTYPGDEYLMKAYNMFDPETGDNVFTQGGKLTTYSVYIQLDDNSGEAKLTNIIDMTNPQTITGVWDKDARTITISTPKSWTDPETECKIIGMDGENNIILQAGEAYGIGYWKPYDELVMDVSADGNTITPRQDFAGDIVAYDDYDESYYEDGFTTILFNAQMFKKAEGANLVVDREQLDFGRCFVGNAVEKSIGIVNTGTETGEYVADVTGEGLSIDHPTGSVNPGESASLKVKLTPQKAENFKGMVTISTDKGDNTVQISANVENLPDYSKITSEGSELVKFTTSLDYPWLLTDTIEAQTVAVTTNAGQGKTTSTLNAEVNVPEGKKVVASWDAVYDPRFASYDEFHVDNDDSQAAVYDTQGRQNVKGSTEMGPGYHDLTFSYQKGFMANSGAIVYGKDYVYLRDLKFHLEDYKASDASLSSDNLDMRRFFLDLGYVTETDSTVTIKNEGSDSLIIYGFKNAANFSGSVGNNKLGEFETTPIRITFSANALGNYEGDVVAQTSAGELTIHCKALVEAPYAYEDIVDEGDFFFMSDRDHPFLVDGNTAYNETSALTDSVSTYSALGCFFNVPQGKTGVLTWEGTADCSSTDYGIFAIDDGLNAEVVKGHNADGSYRVATPALTYPEAGQHYVVFAFQTNGDGKTTGANRYTVSHLKLQLVDELAGVKLWEGDSITLPATYPGYYSTATAHVINLSSENMQLQDTKGAGAFAAKYDEDGWNSASQYGTTEVKFVFTPTAVGQQNNEVTIKTNNGDVVVKCKAKALDNSNLVYFDNFENNGLGWNAINNDDDRTKWETYAGITGYFSDLGEGFLMFNANFIDKAADDYFVSPELSIPAEGATLTFVRKARSERNHTVSYSVKVGEGTDPTTYNTVYSETDNPTDYQQVKVDLGNYAGKKVHVAFFTDAQPGSGLLQVDDFTVTSKVSQGIRTATDATAVNNREYYTIDGKRSANAGKGISIVKATDGNGRQVVRKEIRR